MAINRNFSGTNIKPPTWSGGRSEPCPKCKSKNTTAQGGMWLEDGKLYLKNKYWCINCGYVESTNTKEDVLL